MEKLPLAELAQYFANDGKYKDVASTISDIPRKPGDEYCPYCLGTSGGKVMMKAINPPEGEHGVDEDFYKCRTCNTIFAKNLQGLWWVADA